MRESNITQRVIKFRVFPKKEAYGNDGDFEMYAEMMYSEEADIKRGSGFTIYNDEGFNNDQLNWMQYTGFKDRNGKEIYEGD